MKNLYNEYYDTFDYYLMLAQLLYYVTCRIQNGYNINRKQLISNNEELIFI